MKNFGGTHFDGTTTRKNPVMMKAEGSNLIIEPVPGSGQTGRMEFRLEDLKIEPPLSTGFRIIRLPHPHGHIETPELAAVKAIEESAGVNRAARLLHLFESNLRLTLLACLFTAALIAGLTYYGIPALADRAAREIPPQAAKFISDNAVKELDKSIFKPSKLAEDKKEHIREIYGEFAEKAGIAPSELLFREMAGAPNAFALPSSYIVVTDKMASFVESDDELMGVLAHETAHMAEKHALRQILRNTGVYLLISLATGEVASTLSAGAAIPALLVESGYSRKFEAEADALGASLMVRTGRTVESMIKFLERIEREYPQSASSGPLSTHPSTKSRLENLKALR